eukprot:9867745-Alexandrium_andersonii.AAC.1
MLAAKRETCETQPRIHRSGGLARLTDRVRSTRLWKSDFWAAPPAPPPGLDWPAPPKKRPP